MKRLLVVIDPRLGEPRSNWTVVERGVTYDTWVLASIDDESAFPTGRSMALFDPTLARESFREAVEVPYDPAAWWTFIDEDSAARARRS